MADKNQEIYIARITSNTDKLNSRAIHDVFVDLIRSEVEQGEVFLKALVPKREGDMFAHAGHTGPNDDGIDITASVGIPEIHKIGESDPLSAKYPIYTEGTGIFGGKGDIYAKDKESMYIPSNRGYPGFLKHSKGQPPHGFMAETYALMVGMLEVNGEIFKKKLTAKLQSDKLT